MLGILPQTHKQRVADQCRPADHSLGTTDLSDLQRCSLE